MDEINQQVSKAVEDMKTIRIIADVPTALLSSDDYLASAATLTEPFRTKWETQYLVRFIVVDVYPRHTYVVIDINNHRYDFDTAHLQAFSIPVYILRLSRKSNEWMFFRRPVEGHRVALDIAALHDHNGQTRPPFLADHIAGPVYLSPRTKFSDMDV
ncbi:hypothetical protein BJX99DRAFT_257560 [Aspergillus californicus]